MNKRQISRINAARSVQVVLERWKDSLPEAAQDCQAELVELLESITERGNKQSVRPGFTAGKAQARNTLADAAAALAGALVSYGTSIKDYRLVSACDYSRSDIVAGPDARIAARCNALLEEAKPIVANVTKYKVTTASLNAFKAKIEAFDALQTSPRDGIAQRSAATLQLHRLNRQVQELLSKRLDPLIAPLKETEPTVFNEYRVARKLVNGPTAPAKAETNVVPVPVPATPQAKAA